MPKKNEWLSRFGAKRRAIDKAYCAEAERAIAGEAGAKPTHAGAKLADAAARAAIARAFGRPVH